MASCKIFIGEKFVVDVFRFKNYVSFVIVVFPKNISRERKKMINSSTLVIVSEAKQFPLIYFCTAPKSPRALQVCNMDYFVDAFAPLHNNGLDAGI